MIEGGQRKLPKEEMNRIKMLIFLFQKLLDTGIPEALRDSGGRHSLEGTLPQAKISNIVENQTNLCLIEVRWRLSCYQCQSIGN